MLSVWPLPRARTVMVRRHMLTLHVLASGIGDVGGSLRSDLLVRSTQGVSPSMQIKIYTLPIRATLFSSWSHSYVDVPTLLLASLAKLVSSGWHLSGDPTPTLMPSSIPWARVSVIAVQGFRCTSSLVYMCVSTKWDAELKRFLTRNRSPFSGPRLSNRCATLS